MTANYITLLSSVAMWVMFALSFTSHNLSVTTMAGIFAFLIHFYVVGDHLDGMHAKATNTSSPLGEFLDHYFDLYNIGITVAAIFILIEIDLPYLYYFTLWIYYLAFIGTLIEQKVSGRLYFGYIGSLEGVFIAFAFFISWMFPAGREFWMQTTAIKYFPYSNYWVFIILSVIGCLYTLVDIIKRLHYIPLQLIFFTIISALLILLCSQLSISKMQGWFLMTLYCAHFACNIMESYLCHKKIPYPDTIASVLIAILSINPHYWLNKYPSIDDILFYYLALQVLRSFTRTIKQLSPYWLWVNPK